MAPVIRKQEHATANQALADSDATHVLIYITDSAKTVVKVSYIFTFIIIDRLCYLYYFTIRYAHMENCQRIRVFRSCIFGL